MSIAFVLIPRLLIFVVVFSIIIFIGRKLINGLVQDYRRNKHVRVLSTIIILIACVFLFQFGINSFNKNTLPIGNRVPEKYIIKLNETKESNNRTKVRINNVLLDINTLQFSVGVKGKDKLVAVEIKKNPEEIEVLKEFTGLYLGKRTMYEYNGLGMGISEEEFLETLYVICHLSNGEELSFKVEDINDVKSNVKIVEFNKKLKDNPQIILNKITKGVSHTSIYITSDINFFDLEVTILDGEEEYKEMPSSGSGGFFDYSGPPLKTKDVKIKVKTKYSGEEFIIPVEL